MGVHLCGRCLQPRQNAESGLYATSLCISLGRSVSKCQKTGVWITKFPQKRTKLKQNSPTQDIRRGHSSHQSSFFRILLKQRETKARFIEPMLCLPASSLPEGDQWEYELKLDGYRALA